MDGDNKKWFKPKSGNLTTKYIAPIDYSKINLKDYVERYVNLLKDKSVINNDK